MLLKIASFLLENLRYFFFVLGETLPKIKNCVTQESVEFARVLWLSVEFKFLLHLFPSSLLGFRPLSVEFEWNVTHLSVEFKKRYTFFCRVFVRYMFFRRVQKLRYMFICRVFVRYMFICRVRGKRYMFFCRVFVRYMFFRRVQKLRYMFICRVFVRYMFICRVENCVTCFSVEFGKRYTFFCRVREALHVFLSSFDFSSKIFYKLLNSSTASKIFCTSKLFYRF